MEFEFGMKFKIGIAGTDSTELVERLVRPAVMTRRLASISLAASHWNLLAGRGRSRKQS